MAEDRTAAVRTALDETFHEFFKVDSIYHLNNPPLYEKLKQDESFQVALDRLAAALSDQQGRGRGSSRPNEHSS